MVKIAVRLALALSTSLVLAQPAAAQDELAREGNTAPIRQQPLPTRATADAAEARYLALGSELLRLNDRIAALERLIAQMVSRQEEDHRDVTLLTDELARFRADFDRRMVDVETRPPLAVAETSATLPTTVTGPPPVPVALVDRFEQAMAFASEKDWSSAELALSTFIANHPDDPRIAKARYQLGLAYLGQGQAGQAAAIFLNLFETGAASGFGADNLFALASALRALGDIDPVQICTVYSEIEAAHGTSLSPERREELLDLRLAEKCDQN